MVKKIFVAASVFNFLLGAFFVLAQENPTTAPTNPINSGYKKVVASFDPACIQAAIEKRDSAIIGAFDKFYASVKGALEARKTALKDAWAKTDKKERLGALEKARIAWRSAFKDARASLTKDKKAAWNQYKVARKDCKGINEAEKDGINEASDAQL